MKPITALPQAMVARLVVVNLAICFLASCSTRNDHPVAVTDSSAINTITFPPSEAEVETPSSPDPAALVIDSSVFIAKVDTFVSTGEYYVALSYLPQVLESEPYEYLAGKVDSLLYEDDEMRRSRLPLEIARAYFNLAGLERISLYNNCKYITDATFVRVEHFDGTISGGFIAVFKPLDPSNFTSEVSYCVGSGDIPGRSIEITSREIEDNTLTEHLLKSIEMNSKDVWDVVHIKTAPDNVIYSAITFAKESFLIETNGDKSTTVKTINKDYHIGDIIPVHLEINGKPVLILHMGINETDITWTSLAVFSGKQYEFHRGDRLRGEVYL